MSYKELTEKERKTLYYLIKYPALNNRELSDTTGIKHSTIIAISRKLKEEGYYRDVQIPYLQHLGCELLTFGYGKFNRTAPARAFKEFYKIQIRNFNNTFHFVGSREFGYFMSMTRNYTELKKDIDSFRYYLDKFGLTEKKQWDFLIFPFEISKTINYADFSPLIKHLFNIREEEPQIDLTYEKCRNVTLSTKEKLVYYGLIKYPELPDNAIAKKVGVSRQIFSRMHERFEQEGLMKPAKIPLIKKLGYQIVALGVTRFNSKTPLEKRKDGVKLIATETPHFLNISSNFENVIASAFMNYNEYNTVKNKILDFYKKQGFIKEEPEIFLMVANEIECSKYDYTPLVKRILWPKGVPKEIARLT